ncbi:DUF2971 domain-containing protein [Clostridium beijerinckii]|uniref:DUF2971 domain-containing protein n=1 Tax=Clostridium beijerinckii TaxID=1520 RepID=UPI001F3FCFCE|nr:DUF2971 domain-containing protein [Clostridium beijerinckii]
MFYYRFRSSSELSIKELMYNEIYFASTSECNDPFDGKTFLIFEADKGKWKRLFEFAWRNYEYPNKEIWGELLSEHIVRKGELTYDAALKLDYAQILKEINFSPNPLIADVLGQSILNTLNTYKPKDTYFASFARKNDDLLMWSHYASMHKGYCLIFKAIDNKLYQSPERKKSSITRSTHNGKNNVSYSISDGFEFRDVVYDLNTTFNNAFYYFPEHISGENFDEKKLESIRNWKEQQYLIKHDCWSYENESRLTVSTNSGWLLGGHVEYSPYERLFHYHPNQLVGIILGARMEDKEKLRIREIIKEHINHISNILYDNFPVFDFVLCQATLPDNQRKVIIKEEEIFTLTRTISRTDDDFEEYLTRWKEGEAIVYRKNNSGAYRKKF